MRIAHGGRQIESDGCTGLDFPFREELFSFRRIWPIPFGGCWMKLFVMIVSVVVVVFIAAKILAYFERRLTKLQRSITGVGEAIEQVNESLKNLREDIGEVKYNTLPPAEKDEVDFENRIPLTSKEVLSWKTGQIVELIERTYDYPFTQPLISKYSYKHDHVSATGKEGAYEVHGGWRFKLWGDWTPDSFVVNESEASTSCGGGEIRLYSRIPRSVE